MKYFYLILVVFCIAFPVSEVVAQISIDDVQASEKDVKFKNELKSTNVSSEFYNHARYRAERAAIRKERNYLEFGGGLQGTLTNYNNPWIKVSGGDNAISLMATLYLRHTFTKHLFTIETKFDAKFGYNRMKVETSGTDENGNPYTESNGVWFKNQDEFALSVAPGFKMAKNWIFGTTIKFRSQIASGYLSRTQQEETMRKSTFMAPGYLDVSLGFTYKSPKKAFPIVVNISPVALGAVFVESELVRSNKWDNKEGWQTYGLAGPDKTSKYEGGSSIQIDFDRKFGKSEFLRYRTTLFSFYGWITDVGQKNKISKYSDYLDAYGKWEQAGKDPMSKPVLPIHPTVRWENSIDIKATKYLMTTLSFQLYYNRAQNVDVQTQTLLSVGLTYTFKNK